MYRDDERQADMSVGSWMGTLLLLAIPVINLVPLLCWAIASEKPSKRSYAIACLIWMLIAVVVVALCLILFHAPILTWIKSLIETKPA